MSNMSMTPIDHARVVGVRYGKLTVLALAGKQGKDIMYRCQCDCGNVKDVAKNSLRNKSKSVRSCGCLRFAKRIKTMAMR